MPSLRLPSLYPGCEHSIAPGNTRIDRHAHGRRVNGHAIPHAHTYGRPRTHAYTIPDVIANSRHPNPDARTHGDAYFVSNIDADTSTDSNTSTDSDANSPTHGHS